jgi:hypothetical protein
MFWLSECMKRKVLHSIGSEQDEKWMTNFGVQCWGYSELSQMRCEPDAKQVFSDGWKSLQWNGVICHTIILLLLSTVLDQCRYLHRIIHEKLNTRWIKADQEHLNSACTLAMVVIGLLLKSSDETWRDVQHKMLNRTIFRTYRFLKIFSHRFPSQRSQKIVDWSCDHLQLKVSPNRIDQGKFPGWTHWVRKSFVNLWTSFRQPIQSYVDSERRGSCWGSDSRPKQTVSIRKKWRNCWLLWTSDRS